MKINHMKKLVKKYVGDDRPEVSEKLKNLGYEYVTHATNCGDRYSLSYYFYFNVKEDMYKIAVFGGFKSNYLHFIADEVYLKTYSCEELIENITSIIRQSFYFERDVLMDAIIKAENSAGNDALVAELLLLGVSAFDN
jgi:FPC/CPF motif-containing protein YcgG